MTRPWKSPSLEEWSIVGMNHYQMDGQRFLFVAMTWNGSCITEEGPDDIDLWRKLATKALQVRASKANDPDDAKGV